MCLKIKDYNQDKSGVDLSSLDGKRMELLKEGGFASVTDLTPASAVPGDSTAMAPVVVGSYSADYIGIKYQGSTLVQWSSCCV